MADWVQFRAFLPCQIFIMGAANLRRSVRREVQASSASCRLQLIGPVELEQSIQRKRLIPSASVITVYAILSLRYLLRRQQFC